MIFKKLSLVLLFLFMLAFSLLIVEISIRLLNNNQFEDDYTKLANSKYMWNHISDPNYPEAYNFFNDTYKFDKVLGYSRELPEDNQVDVDSDKEFEIAFIGDSITEQGKYIEPMKYNNDEGCFPELVLTNYGVVGYSTYQELEVLNKYVIDTNPDLVVLQISVNDFNDTPVFINRNGKWIALYSPGWWFSPDLYVNSRSYALLADQVLKQKMMDNRTIENNKKNIQEPLAEIKTVLEEENIPLVVVGFPYFGNNRYSESLTSLNEIITELSVNYYIDLSDIYEKYDRREISLDVAHPNIFGGQLAANKILSFLIENDLINNIEECSLIN